MQFDFLSLLKDHGVDHTTNHQHCTEGWVNVHCPHCVGRPNYHLGIHLVTGICHCWRCGSHSLFSTLAKLLSVSGRKVARILRQYQVAGVLPYKAPEKPSKVSEVVPPFGLRTLTPLHRRYLESRNFNVDELEQLWGVRSTGPVGSYKGRIYIPIMYRNDLISFQTRAVAASVKPRYKTCRKSDEKIHHKYVVYGIDYVINNAKVIVVEGVTDVWRIGPGAVATFGITFTLSQVLLLSMFDSVYIMYDDERRAQHQAMKLAYNIQLVAGNNVYLIDKYGSDPGELPPSKVEKIRELVYG